MTYGQSRSNQNIQNYISTDGFLHLSFTKEDLVAEAAGRACLLVMKSHYRHGCFIMTIITADKQLVRAKDQRGERNRRREKVIESFGGTFS